MKPLETVFFIVEGRRLEAQACVLAPTLKRQLSRTQKAIAYVPTAYAPHLLDYTRQVLERSNIEIRLLPQKDLTNTNFWTKPYPHGNKIIAASMYRNTDVSVFLDTDMIMAQPVDFHEILENENAAAVVSDFATGSFDEAFWEPVYKSFELDLPSERVKYLSGRRHTGLPYFNAGMVAFRENVPVGDDQMSFGKIWMDVARKIDGEIPRDRLNSNLDQVALPVAGYLIDTPVKILKNNYNFNINTHAVDAGHFPEIVHYHKIGVLWHNTHLAEYALDCLCRVMGPDSARALADHFGTDVKRKRLKRYFTDI